MALALGQNAKQNARLDPTAGVFYGLSDIANSRYHRHRTNLAA